MKKALVLNISLLLQLSSSAFSYPLPLNGDPATGDKLNRNEIIPPRCEIIAHGFMIENESKESTVALVSREVVNVRECRRMARAYVPIKGTILQSESTDHPTLRLEAIEMIFIRAGGDPAIKEMYQ